MKRSFIIIYNPISGIQAKASLLSRVQQELKAEGYPFIIRPSRVDGVYHDVIEEIRTHHYTDCIIVGGDGTVNQVVNALRHLDICFGIIPAGSGNGLAFGAGIKKSVLKALGVILNGRAVATDAFMVNDQFALMLAGLGMDADIAYHFHQQKKRGLTTYIRSTARQFFKAKTYSFLLESAELNIELASYFIDIANSNQYGNHFTIAPGAKLTDGLLDVVLVPKMSKVTMLMSILKQVRSGRYNIQKKSGILYFQTRKIQIRNPDLARLHIDGDVVETAALIQIEILPKAFKMMMP